MVSAFIFWSLAGGITAEIYRVSLLASTLLNTWRAPLLANTVTVTTFKTSLVGLQFSFIAVTSTIILEGAYCPVKK